MNNIVNDKKGHSIVNNVEQFALKPDDLLVVSAMVFCTSKGMLMFYLAMPNLGSNELIMS